MLLQRFIVALILAPLALFIVYRGGALYTLIILGILLIATWEFTRLLSLAHLKPAKPFVLGGVLALALAHKYPDLIHPSWILILFVLLSSTYYIYQYEYHREDVLKHLGASILAILYIGGLGSYLLTIRFLPKGMYWLTLTLLIVWTSDTAAYFIGTYFGAHPLSPRLSPNKTWEGYYAGLVGGVLAGMGFSPLLNSWGAGWGESLWPGAILGILLSLTIPLGDLTGSMIKRTAQVKDSGNLFPGHGGMFDRLDTVLWAVPLSTFFIQHIYPHLGKL